MREIFDFLFTLTPFMTNTFPNENKCPSYKGAYLIEVIFKKVLLHKFVMRVSKKEKAFEFSILLHKHWPEKTHAVERCHATRPICVVQNIKTYRSFTHFRLKFFDKSTKLYVSISQN